MSSVVFPSDATTGYAAGQNGTILKTTNGGDGAPPSDSTPPVITDGQTGDDVVRVTNSGSYNIDFTDAGGSNLLQFQIRVCSAARLTAAT